MKAERKYRTWNEITGCIICGEPGSARCSECLRVLAFVEGTKDHSALIVIADGSFGYHGKSGSSAGAGLVLADESTEAVIAYRSCFFHATNSDDAEEEAALRALRWAPTGMVWTDSTHAVRRLGASRSRWIPHELRDPLHNLAHKLSVIGRHRSWDRLDRLWIPGEVWP